MLRNIRYFIAQSKYNVKNAHALTRSFWIGVMSMMMNNITFFVIWLLFMRSTGPINGWTGLDVFGMLGVALISFGVTNALFYGIVDLPHLVERGTFDSVLLSPANAFLKIGGSSFQVTAYGDLAQGIIVAVIYAFLAKFTLYTVGLYILGIVLGCIIFVCVRLVCSLMVFFVRDGEIISDQLFEIFIRPGLYPGSIFPNKLKIFFMTVVPALLTSAVPIDIIKSNSWRAVLPALGITAVWVIITVLLFKVAIKRYESGNYLR